MLDPDYLLRVSEGAEDIAEKLHTDIIKRIVKRIMLRIGRGEDYLLTATDKWQIENLQQAGYLLEDIQKDIVKATGLQMKEIAEAFEDAGVTALEYDDNVYKAAGLFPKPLTESPELIRLMQRNYEATLGEWQNFTRTTADAAQRLFLQEIDKAYNLVATGSLSYTAALKEVLNEIVSEGVKVRYTNPDTGRVWEDTIETATLRAIRTGVSQACADITDARMEEMDWDIILNSSHLGARVTDREDYTNHYWWQGKFYSKSGKDNRFPPYSVCGFGNIRGIHGASCRHSHGPGDGEFNPFDHYDSEENRKAYELSQKQRAMERKIRHSKQKAMGLKEAVDNSKDESIKQAMDTLYQKQAAALQQQNAKYKEFCAENNLKPLQERLMVAKWDRQQAAAARGAARRYENAK